MLSSISHNKSSLRLFTTYSKSLYPSLSSIYSHSTPNSTSPSTSSSETPKKWSRHVISNKQPLQNLLEKETPSPVSTPKKRKRRTLKPLKAPITLTQNAIDHLKILSNGPNPKLIRISVQNRGCSGLTYHLEYVSKPEKFDEIVIQNNIKILIDSKALFSIIGSEMDWVDNKLSSKFVFKNPNSKGTCGCGESFMV
ncbi:Fe-binding Fe/S cluster assembly protein [Pichia kluyveri]|uniref:Iron-sulfur assembly protein 1 n=1 Tax=Pichia kluyveri TaxID=36015 RepID=A0AAV5R0R8_PICKL|nr:Fe-binding Fe/S cluster assembly protein [Pichia kluyveri]